MQTNTIQRAVRIAAATAALGAAALPAAAQAATSTYPAGGSSFTGSAQGWTGSGTSCSPLNAAASTCQQSAQYDGSAGAGGSLAAKTDITLNLLSLFKGQSSFTSPDFTIPAGASTTGASVHFDRSFETPALIGLAPQTVIATRLIDRTTGASTAIANETLGTTPSLTSTAASVSPFNVVAGHTYAIGFDTTTTTTLAALPLQGSMVTRFDNVGLTVTSSGTNPTPTPTPPGGGDVVIYRHSLTNSQIDAILRTINIYADHGKLEGGSIVPRGKCTIIGTKKADKIKGTKGNDVICARGGNDKIDGGGGRDIIDTGSGNDVANGKSGNDAIAGLAGKDRISGSTGNDKVGGGASADRLAGNSGKDRISGGKSGDRIAGGSGADRISARDKHRDRIDGGSGKDKATYDRRARRGARASSARTINKRADRVKNL